MGADLIINVLAEPADPNVKLNWTAGDELIDATVTTPELEAWAVALDQTGRLEDCLIDGDPEKVDYGKVKDEVKDIFLKLKEEVIDGGARDVTAIKVRDLWLTISGGMSWGDDPTDACGYMQAAEEFPEILSAIGFVADWTEEA